MNTIDIMLDLETIGTRPGSVVLAIGAVPSEGDPFYRKIDLRDSLYLGLTLDVDTMSWWRKQAREAWLSSTDATVSLEFALIDFDEWLLAARKGSDAQTTGNKIRLWGDAASFDCVLLKGVYTAAGKHAPWNYTEEFCYRTLRTLLGSEKPRAKLQHDALSDARAQLFHLQEMLKRLGV